MLNRFQLSAAALTLAATLLPLAPARLQDPDAAEVLTSEQRLELIEQSQRFRH